MSDNASIVHGNGYWRKKSESLIKEYMCWRVEERKRLTRQKRHLNRPASKKKKGIDYAAGLDHPRSNYGNDHRSEDTRSQHNSDKNNNYLNDNESENRSSFSISERHNVMKTIEKSLDDTNIHNPISGTMDDPNVLDNNLKDIIYDLFKEDESALANKYSKIDMDIYLTQEDYTEIDKINQELKCTEKCMQHQKTGDGKCLNKQNSTTSSKKSRDKTKNDAMNSEDLRHSGDKNLEEGEPRSPSDNQHHHHETCQIHHTDTETGLNKHQPHTPQRHIKDDLQSNYTTKSNRHHTLTLVADKIPANLNHHHRHHNHFHHHPPMHYNSHYMPYGPDTKFSSNRTSYYPHQPSNILPSRTTRHRHHSGPIVSGPDRFKPVDPNQQQNHSNNNNSSYNNSNSHQPQPPNTSSNNYYPNNRNGPENSNYLYPPHVNQNSNLYYNNEYHIAESHDSFQTRSVDKYSMHTPVPTEAPTDRAQVLAYNVPNSNYTANLSTQPVYDNKGVAGSNYTANSSNNVNFTTNQEASRPHNYGFPTENSIVNDYPEYKSLIKAENYLKDPSNHYDPSLANEDPTLDSDRNASYNLQSNRPQSSNYHPSSNSNNNNTNSYPVMTYNNMPINSTTSTHNNENLNLLENKKLKERTLSSQSEISIEGYESGQISKNEPNTTSNTHNNNNSKKSLTHLNQVKSMSSSKNNANIMNTSTYMPATPQSFTNNTNTNLQNYENLSASVSTISASNIPTTNSMPSNSQILNRTSVLNLPNNLSSSSAYANNVQPSTSSNENISAMQNSINSLTSVSSANSHNFNLKSQIKTESHHSGNIKSESTTHGLPTMTKMTSAYNSITPKKQRRSSIDSNPSSLALQNNNNNNFSLNRSSHFANTSNSANNNLQKSMKRSTSSFDSHADSTYVESEPFSIQKSMNKSRESDKILFEKLGKLLGTQLTTSRIPLNNKVESLNNINMSIIKQESSPLMNDMAGSPGPSGAGESPNSNNNNAANTNKVSKANLLTLAAKKMKELEKLRLQQKDTMLALNEDVADCEDSLKSVYFGVPKQFTKKSDMQENTPENSLKRLKSTLRQKYKTYIDRDWRYYVFSQLIMKSELRLEK